jgi:hypothetical protein
MKYILCNGISIRQVQCKNSFAKPTLKRETVFETCGFIFRSSRISSYQLMSNWIFKFPLILFPSHWQQLETVLGNQWLKFVRCLRRKNNINILTCSSVKCLGMSGSQDTQKSDNSDLPETGSDGGEAQNGSPPANYKGAEGTKSDKQKSKLCRICACNVLVYSALQS